MNKPIRPEKIAERLKFFGYKYSIDENTDQFILKSTPAPGATLTIYMPLFSVLKVNFEEHKVTMKGHNQFIGKGRTLETQFYLNSAFICLFIYLFKDRLAPVIYVLVPYGLLILRNIICHIKMEAMKTIIHQWIERDSENYWEESVNTVTTPVV
ncbi:MAG: hypothetical protein IPP77_10375 [Bacteroidetes bacterium]|nr:hypothetical protein [Bacteroidota bacterium]